MDLAAKGGLTAPSESGSLSSPVSKTPHHSDCHSCFSPPLTFVTATSYYGHHTMSSTTTDSSQRASPQGGILQGANPSQYDPKNPIILFIIQVMFHKSV